MPSLTPDLVEDAARVDPDRTLATSFLSAPQRSRVIALILFAHEIARARAAVSEPGLAAIRLQWWRDIIEQIYSDAKLHAQPIAVVLAATVQEADLPREYLDAMIDAYERELDPAPFSTWQDLESHLDATSGNLNRLCLLASGIKTIGVSADTAAREAGIGWGLARFIATLPQWSSRRSTWLPADRHEHIDLEAIYAGVATPTLIGFLKDGQARVKTACKSANSALVHAKLGNSFAVLAPTCLAKRYARANMPLVATGWSRLGDISLLERQLRLTLAVARGRI